MTPHARRYIRRQWNAYARWIMAETSKMQRLLHKPAAEVAEKWIEA